jgi:dipeptidyl aminopeptidase/acylaminoacyl peptidase
VFISAYRRAYREREIHAALTERGQECELLVHGDEGHGLPKHGNRADAAARALAFLARHLTSQRSQGFS